MKELEIIVCIKQVPDPEGPPSSFKIDSEAKKVTAVGIPPVINPFDENALEVALQLKERHGGRVICISLGEKLARPVLIKALAVGADELILIEDEGLKGLDSRSIAYVLSAAIEKIGKYDLILVGRQSSDWGFGQTGLILAEILQIPGISLAQKVEAEDGKVVVKKLKRIGCEIVKTSMPALITVDSLVGDLRFPSLKALMAARKKPLTSWGIAELGVDTQRLVTQKIHRLFSPQSRDRTVLFIKGESPHEKGEMLALKLRQRLCGPKYG